MITRGSSEQRGGNMTPDQGITKGTFLDRGLYHWMGEQTTASIWGLIELDVPLSGALMEKSLELLIAAVPTLSARLELGLWRSLWKYVDPGDISRLIRIQDTDTREDADRLLKDVVRNPIDTDAPPLFRITAINAPDVHYLALQVHHLVVDGEGAKQLFMLFAEIYRELAKSPDWQMSSYPVVRRGWGQVMRYAKWRGYLMAPWVHALETISMLGFFLFRRKESSGIIKGDFPEATESAVPVEPYYEGISIDKTSLKKMKKFNVTINDVMLAALMATVKDWNESLGKSSSRIVTGYTADMRIWWGKPSGTFANLSIVRLLSINAKKVENVYHAVRVVKSKMQKAKKRFGVKEIWDMALMALQPSFFGKMAGRVIPELTKDIHALTNMGIIPDIAGDFGRAKALSYSLLAPPLGSPCVIFSASSYKNHLTIYGNFDAVHLKRETAERFMALLKKNILIYAYVNPVQVTHLKRNEVFYSDLDSENEVMLEMRNRTYHENRL